MNATRNTEYYGMSTMKTYEHESPVRDAQRSRNYQFTLPVQAGEILDDQVGRLAQLRATVRSINAPRRQARQGRFVIDLKWRGPRYGARYTTARQHARAVDVYVRLRVDWEAR